MSSIAISVLGPELRGPRRFENPSMLRTSSEVFRNACIYVNGPRFMAFISSVSAVSVTRCNGVLRESRTFPRQYGVRFTRVASASVVEAQI